VVLCPAMRAILPPKLPMGGARQFEAWTELYICLCLRKVALDLHETHPYKPLFLFFQEDNNTEQEPVDPAGAAFLRAQHFMVESTNPFEWPEEAVAPGTNTGITNVINMIHSLDYRRDAHVGLESFVTMLLRSHQSWLDRAKKVHADKEVPIVLFDNGSSRESTEAIYKLLEHVRDASLHGLSHVRWLSAAPFVHAAFTTPDALAVQYDVRLPVELGGRKACIDMSTLVQAGSAVTTDGTGQHVPSLANTWQRTGPTPDVHRVARGLRTSRELSPPYPQWFIQHFAAWAADPTKLNLPAPTDGIPEPTKDSPQFVLAADVAKAMEAICSHNRRLGTNQLTCWHWPEQAAEKLHQEALAMKAAHVGK
jgi:hypothetical protein